MRIGFIGAGKMAQALARGLINSGKFLKMHFLQLLPSKSRVVRVMPNTPAVVRAGASAFSMGSACRDGDAEIVKDLLSTVGFAMEVPEIHIDPVTGLSGSGPSYVRITFDFTNNSNMEMFAVIEGLADGGVKVGLPRDLAIKLAAHTLYGAAKMVLETGVHPAQLKDDVQSPGGSSVYGMHRLESGGLKTRLYPGISATQSCNLFLSRSTLNLPQHEKNDEEFAVVDETTEKQSKTPNEMSRNQTFKIEHIVIHAAVDWSWAFLQSQTSRAMKSEKTSVIQNVVYTMHIYD
uniref:pyrroline-5-carboxylate reductase n=1 Tax=Heterorhabditis bacteriophora TaxID=37862 RepID=A0A1I7WSJ5_HETBA